MHIPCYCCCWLPCCLVRGFFRANIAMVSYGYLSAFTCALRCALRCLAENNLLAVPIASVWRRKSLSYQLLLISYYYLAKTGTGTSMVLDVRRSAVVAPWLGRVCLIHPSPTCLLKASSFQRMCPGKYATVDDFRPESFRLEIFQLIRSRWATAREQFAFGVYWNAKFLGKYLSGSFFSPVNGPIARNLHHLAVESSLYIDIKDNYQLGNWESFFPSFLKEKLLFPVERAPCQFNLCSDRRRWGITAEIILFSPGWTLRRQVVWFFLPSSTSKGLDLVSVLGARNFPPSFHVAILVLHSLQTDCYFLVRSRYLLCTHLETIFTFFLVEYRIDVGCRRRRRFSGQAPKSATTL